MFEEDVYCKNCKHFWIGAYGHEFCNSPKNFKDSYYGPKSERKNIPQALNITNNCKLYEEKFNLIKWIKRGFKK